MRIVLDCSVTMSFLLKDEDSPIANKVRDSLKHENGTAIVPPLWKIEVRNAFLSAERQFLTLQNRMRITKEETDHILSLVNDLPITVDNECHIFSNLSETLTLARDHDLSFYDACYLELAQRKNIPLATLDKKMKKSAKRIGIEILV